MTHFERELKHAEKEKEHLLKDADKKYQKALRDCERYVSQAEQAVKEAEEGGYKTFASCGGAHLSERRIATPEEKAYFKDGKVQAGVVVEDDSHQETRTKTSTMPIPFWIPGTTIVGGVVRQKKETEVVNVPEVHTYLVVKAPGFTYVTESGWGMESFAEKVNETASNWRKIKKERKEKIKQAQAALDEAEQQAKEFNVEANQEIERVRGAIDEHCKEECDAAVEHYREEGHPIVPPSQWK